MKTIQLITFLVVMNLPAKSQRWQLYNSYYEGSYKVYTTTYQSIDLQIFLFNQSDSDIKVKYLATQPSSRFYQLKRRKQILLTCTAGFSTSWMSNAKPKGLTVEKGRIINRVLQSSMDGLVIIHNFGNETGRLTVIDLNYPIVYTGIAGQIEYDLKDYYDRRRFLRWVQRERLTLFQTQVMYANQEKGFSNRNLYYGDKALRRFLVQCTKKRTRYQAIINIPEDPLELNYASTLVYEFLDRSGYSIESIVNLDTGGKNILYAYDDLEDFIFKSEKPLYYATNLIVYYLD